MRCWVAVTFTLAANVCKWIFPYPQLEIKFGLEFLGTDERQKEADMPPLKLSLIVQTSKD